MVLDEILQTVEERKRFPQEGSYTNYLLEKGLDKILKKVGEEAAETIIAAKNPSDTELTGEVADLLYHLTVMLSVRGLSWQQVFAVLEQREQKVLRLRYGLNNRPPMTQREIARKLNISRSYVSRLEKHAIERLREEMTK